MSSIATKPIDGPISARRADDSSRSWGRDREPGTAFRGMSRGRGRGGGRGRTGRGGGGGGGRSGMTGKGPAEKVDSQKPTAQARPALPDNHNLSEGMAHSTTSEKVSAGRGLAKTLPRPILSVQPVTSQAADPTSPLTPSKSNSRRRKNTHKRTASGVLPKVMPSPISDRSPITPSVPQTLMPSKELPPHLASGADSTAPVHDIRQDIYSLVEHVRSIAMESHRPSSPSTHIDWAGDDEDGLPDLDDWGVSSKLMSEAGEAAAKPESDSAPGPVLAVSQCPVRAPIPESIDGVLNQPKPTPLDVSRRSGDSPAESTVLLSAPARRDRERKRERGRGKDKERKAASAASQADAQLSESKPIITLQRKSLLERLSSPTRPEPLALPSQPDLSPVEPKPHLPLKPAALSKASQSDNSPPKEDHAFAQEPVVSDGLGTYLAKGKLTEHNGPAEDTSSISSNRTSETKVDLLDANDSFDWSEEPVSFDSVVPNAADRPHVDIEPPTPLEDGVAYSSSTFPVSTSKSILRQRSQRPLSTEIIPHQRRERSPHRTHNPRNHSAPHVGPGHAAARTRAPHSTRPVIRVDALAMLTRSLRESPTPPRHESPAPSSITTEE
ncbi:hypothetical protein DFH11DRAFT_1723253 [Phellopilus nigrolimitatus]|nr:hypothetical protein DFH11DRAFT_1723253 [Phellopilus nigrolimitatus]